MISICKTTGCPHPFVNSKTQTMPMHKKQYHGQEYKNTEAQRILNRKS